MKKAIIIILIAVALCALIIFGVLHFFKYVSYPKDKTGMMNTNKVYCDEKFFRADREDFLYEPGSTVQLQFPLPADGVSYSFWSIGVDKLDVSLEPGKAYTIEFEMPNNYISVYYKVDESINGIAISMEENPSTGFTWICEQSPKGILAVVEERYVSDEVDSEVPLVGVGGMHYWKFKVVQSGTVELTFRLCRGDELMDTVTYTYKCDCTDGSFVEE